MSRIIAACFAVVALLAMVPAAFAREIVTHTVDSAGMKLRFPSNWVVLTDLSEDGDPGLEWIGMTADEVNAFLSSRRIQMNAIDPDFSREITVSVAESESSRTVWNLATADSQLVESLQEAYLNLNAENLQEGLEINLPELSEQIGVSEFQITKSDERKTSQAHFLMFEGNMVTTEGASEIYQAVTIINGQQITLVIRPQGVLSEEDIQLLNSLVETAQFERVEDKPVPEGAFPVNIYVIVAIGIFLMIAGGLIDRHRRKKGRDFFVTVPAWSIGGRMSQASPPAGGPAPAEDSPTEVSKEHSGE